MAYKALFLLAGAARGLDLGRPLSRRVAAQRFGFAAGAAALAAPLPGGAYKGVYGMDAPAAKDAIKDTEALTSPTVKAALGDLKQMSASIAKMEAGLAADPQYDLAAVVKADFPVSKVRATFNALNVVFDEDTQKSTDRLERGMLQDLVEIQAQATVAAGKARSPKKIALVTEKLGKLQAVIDQLDAFFL